MTPALPPISAGRSRSDPSPRRAQIFFPDDEWASGAVSSAGRSAAMEDPFISARRTVDPDLIVPNLTENEPDNQANEASAPSTSSPRRAAGPTASAAPAAQHAIAEGSMDGLGEPGRQAPAEADADGEPESFAEGAPPEAEAESRRGASEERAEPAGRSTRAGLLMASGTIVSRVMGLLRTILLAAAIGAVGQISDIWNVANTLPNQIYGTIAGGVFSAILVPLIVRASKAADRGADYLSRLLTLLISFLAIITIGVTIAAPFVIRAFTDFTPAQEQIAVHLAYYLFPQIFFYGLYAIVGQVLNAHESYGPFMWSPVLNNVIALATLGMFIAVFGGETHAFHHTLANWTPEKSALLGIGTTAGIVAQAAVLLWPLKKLGLRLRPNFNFRGVGLREAGKLAGWSVLTMILGNIPTFVYIQVETVASNYRAAHPNSPDVILGPAALASAVLLNELPHAVIAVSLATILVNRLSHAAADNNMRRLKDVLNHGLRVLGLPLIAASTAIIILSGQLGFVFSFGHGRDGVLIGITTIIMVLTGPLYSASVILARTFYTLNDAKTPFLITVIMTTFSILAARTVLLFHPEHTIFLVAASTSTANALTVIVTHWFLKRKIGPYGLPSIIASWMRYTLAALVAAAAGAGVLWLVGGYSESGFPWRGMIQAILTCVMVAPVIFAVYVGVLRLIRAPELEDVAAPLLRRFRR